VIYILINLWPILAATLLGLGIGLGVLAAARLALPGLSTIAGMAIAQFWLAAILAGALILAPREAGAWVMAIGSAVVIWIGFVVPVLWVSFAAYGLPARRAGLAMLYWLLAMVGEAALMQAIELAPPPAA
jgi:hypothetical protein